ncbi:MAG TPA: hypothetical protein VE800_10605, partial [Actinomycetota bacterium]|nr:hypothetical protein [Actinomycetota bacterium]
HRHRFGHPRFGYGGMNASTGEKEWFHMKRLLSAAPLAVLLAACEDAGNEGNDNLLTGGSLVLVVIVVVVVILLVRRRG